MDKLNEVLPPFWSHGNPVDVIGDAPPERFAKATEIVLQDDKVDAVLVILTPQAMTEPTKTAEAIAKISEQPPNLYWLHGWVANHGRRKESIPEQRDLCLSNP